MGQVKSSTLGRLFGGAELDAHIDRLEARLAELGGRQAESLFSAVSRYRVGNESSRTPQPASRGTAAGASKVAKARGASGAPETDWEEF
jgi:hypothetical protein